MDDEISPGRRITCFNDPSAVIDSRIGSEIIQTSHFQISRETKYDMNNLINGSLNEIRLDRVGSVDNLTSTDMFHPFVQTLLAAFEDWKQKF